MTVTDTQLVRSFVEQRCHCLCVTIQVAGRCNNNAAHSTLMADAHAITDASGSFRLTERQFCMVSTVTDMLKHWKQTMSWPVVAKPLPDFIS